MEEKMQTIDMKCIRYINLFEKITKIRTKDCFSYNNFIIFAVPSSFVSKAIGKEGRNVRNLVRILGRRVKIVSSPRGIEDSREFISQIVSPIQFRNLEISQNEIIINGTTQSKAALIGRNKVRLEELKNIVEQHFGKSLRII